MTHKQPIRVFTSFSGYDSQCMALDRLGVAYDLVGWSEIDKYAIQAHNQLFSQFAERNLGDIREIDWSKVPDFDLFTMSSPCQDFSTAGLQQGGEEGSGTRSSLLWECRRAIASKRPKYIVFENVKGLVNKKFRPYFLKWQDELSGLGYTNFAQVLNAKDHGVAQNRERVFMVSILGGGWYNFPQKQRLTKCLADYLEDEVDERYYLSEKMLAGFKASTDRHNEKGNGFAFKPNDPDKPARTIQTKEGGRKTDNFIKVAGRNDISCKKLNNGNYRFHRNDVKKTGIQGIQELQIIDPSNESCAITTTHQPKILQRGRGFNEGGSFDLCPTISKSAWEQNNVVETKYIRRLTPLECFRLMDVSDSDFDKLHGISDTQLYKMAGNSIAIACLVGIFSNLLNR